jgi:hypothetical protein
MHKLKAYLVTFIDLNYVPLTLSLKLQLKSPLNDVVGPSGNGHDEEPKEQVETPTSLKKEQGYLMEMHGGVTEISVQEEVQTFVMD